MEKKEFKKRQEIILGYTKAISEQILKVITDKDNENYLGDDVGATEFEMALVLSHNYILGAVMGEKMDLISSTHQANRRAAEYLMLFGNITVEDEEEVQDEIKGDA